MAAAGTYSINITDATGDTWTIAVRYANTLSSDGSVYAPGATTAGNIHVALQKAVEAVKNHISINGHN
jgi:hypothetical protein